MPNKAPTASELRRAAGSRPLSYRQPDLRESAAKRGYGRVWARARRLHLNREPLCRICAEEGRTTPATCVDHIIPLREGGRASGDNLQSLCAACHNRKHKRNIEHDRGSDG